MSASAVGLPPLRPVRAPDAPILIRALRKPRCCPVLDKRQRPLCLYCSAFSDAITVSYDEDSFELRCQNSGEGAMRAVRTDCRLTEGKW